MAFWVVAFFLLFAALGSLSSLGFDTLWLSQRDRWGFVYRY